MEMKVSEKLGRMLSAACYEKYKERGESMEAVAAGANVSVNSACSALKDGTTTRRSTWIKICDTLGVDFEEIEKKYRKMEEKKAMMEEATEARVEAVPETAPEGVMVNADPVELYRLYLFCEERMADNLRMGTRMEPEQLYKLMQAMYALRDASLALQPGEVVTPQEAAQDGKPA